jgi:hypothetical protein
MTVKRTGGRTPAYTNHSSRTSFDNLQQAIEALVTAAPENHTQAKNSVSESVRKGVVSHRFCRLYVVTGFDALYHTELNANMLRFSLMTRMRLRTSEIPNVLTLFLRP